MPRKLILHKRSSVTRYKEDEDRYPFKSTYSKTDQHLSSKPKLKQEIVLFKKLDVQFSRDELLWGRKNNPYKGRDSTGEDLYDFCDLMKKFFITKQILKLCTYYYKLNIHKYISFFIYISVAIYFIIIFVKFMI